MPSNARDTLKTPAGPGDYGARWKQWSRRFSQLMAYKGSHGSANVSQLVPTLGPWLSSQRVARRQGVLHPARERLLEEAGVIWDPGKERASRWVDHYRALLDFMKEHGHCNVSRREHPYPGIWVSAQRTAFRKQCLAPERFLLLDRLQFQWSLRPGVELPKKLPSNKWTTQFEKWERSPKGAATAPWMRQQAQRIEDGSITPEQKELLTRSGLL